MTDSNNQQDQDKLAAKKAAVLGSTKKKRPPLFTVAAVAVIAGLFTWVGISNVSGKGRQAAEGNFVGVSALKAAPDQYQGEITVKGVAGRVLADAGVIELSDEKACCSIFVLAPISEQQQTTLQTTERYTGRYPAAGAEVTVSGTLVKGEGGYRFVMAELRQDGHALLTRQ